MSKRTAEASKAIRAAWEKEQQLVLNGEGTREWTPEQQQSIIDKGKAYDDDGKAFEGHHMKSVKAFPEYQGEADNIQFLSRSEHLDAHGGSYRNETNGYYDPVTGETREFGDEPYKPCEIIKLKDPIVSPAGSEVEVPTQVDTIETDKENISGEQNIDEKRDTESAGLKEKETIEKGIEDEKRSALSVRIKEKAKKFGNSFLDGLVEFSDRHPVIQGFLNAAYDHAIDTSRNETNRIIQENMKSINEMNNDLYLFQLQNQRKKNLPKVQEVDETTLKVNEVPLKMDNPVERSSPDEHMVKGHRQRYHTKNGIEYRDKDPFPRGGKKE